MYKIIAIIFTLLMNLYGQVIIHQTLDITGGLSNGTIEGTVTPNFTNDSLAEVFDGNPLTEAGVTDTNYLQITLRFLEPVNFSFVKVYFWNTGLWTLEIAETEADLNNKIGSYQLLVNQRYYAAFAWDSLSFESKTTTYIRLTANNPQSNGIYLGEWNLASQLTLTSLFIYPYPPKVIPGYSLQLKVKSVDENEKLHPYALNEPVVWSIDDLNIATVSESGKLTGVATGNTRVVAKTASGSLLGEAPVLVVNDFTVPKAETRVVKVALVIQDPVIDSTNNKRIHQLWGWNDPYNLINQLLEEFRAISQGVIDFQIVETYDDEHIFTTLDGNLMSVDTLAYYFNPANQALYGRTKQGTLQNLAEVQGRVQFDYKAMADQYNFGTKRNNGEIDEVWVYSFPFSGMYESQLMGPNAFWWNSPPIRDYPGLEKLLSVMGWNYERGVAEALHSFGHRMESAMWHAYGRWDTKNENPNSWELFTRIDKDVPGGAQVGNVHFPPNGLSHYDYGNRRTVVSYADNWKRYPFLLDQSRPLNCEEWGCSQLGYMRWWFSHIPHFQGVYEGILNNWWLYAVDYETAEELAKNLSVTAIVPKKGYIPNTFQLFQNYPNPFNSTTTIPFNLNGGANIRLQVFDILGKKIATLVDNSLPAGKYKIPFDGRQLASGIYLYRLNVDGQYRSRKMLLLK